jgi:hypothetical protein
VNKAFVLVILGLMLGLAADAQLPVLPSGLFSDMRYIKEAGDVVGTEIFITYGDGEYWAQVQRAEGEPSEPHLAKVDVQGTKLSFELAFNETHIEYTNGIGRPKVVHYNPHFDGEFSRDRLVGKFNTDGRMLTLKRGKSYWQ